MARKSGYIKLSRNTEDEKLDDAQKLAPWHVS